MPAPAASSVAESVTNSDKPTIWKSRGSPDQINSSAVMPSKTATPVYCSPRLLVFSSGQVKHQNWRNHMQSGAGLQLMTTAEAADYLRLRERKLYELVANRQIPCTK